MLLGFFDKSLDPKSSRFNLFTDHILGSRFLRGKISDPTAYFSAIFIHNWRTASEEQRDSTDSFEYRSRSPY